MDFKYLGLRDKHLNVFSTYNTSDHLENNITKAFVNVIQSFSENDLRIIVKDLFELELPNKKISTSFYLQKKPTKEDILKYQTRIIFAFSPTGECWGIDGADTKNIDVIKQELNKQADIKNLHGEEKRKFITINLDDILKQRLENGSIPDGWIFINVDNKPYALVALENKLFDLDPFQLNNHIEKSLYIKVNKPTPLYKKYQDIILSFEKTNNYLSYEFIEYLIRLGYSTVKDFSVACFADEQIRSRLALQFGFEILSQINSGIIDYRDKLTARCKVNYNTLREINLKFAEKNIELWLSFGPTMVLSKEMLQTIEPFTITSRNFSHSYQGFHLLSYGYHQIIKGSYVDDWNLFDYINFWKNNTSLLKTMSSKEIIKLYKQFRDAGLINDNNLNYIIDKFENKSTKACPVAEISLVYSWSYEDAGLMGLISFAKSIKDCLEEALFNMKII